MEGDKGEEDRSSEEEEEEDEDEGLLRSLTRGIQLAHRMCTQQVSLPSLARL